MSTTILSHKDYCLSKYRNESVPFLINRKLMISKQLEKPGTTFMAVGAGHLAGTTSVQHLLSAYGITAERVQY